MRNVGVREISRKTGFSPATVSNALNRKRGVNKETAAIILRAARELGYDRSNHITHINFVQARKTERFSTKAPSTWVSSRASSVRRASTT